MSTCNPVHKTSKVGSMAIPKLEPTIYNSGLTIQIDADHMIRLTLLPIRLI